MMIPPPRTASPSGQVDRKLNVLFGFLLVVIFIGWADPVQKLQVLAGLLLALLFSFLSFLSGKLTLDGMFAASTVGGFVFGFGGWEGAAVVLLFFLSSALLSGRWKTRKQELSKDDRRDGLQVWANGFWLVVSFMLLPVLESGLLILSALGALAAATSDTWATEVGTRTSSRTYLVTSFRKVAKGTDGGVSFSGTLAALAGSAVLGAAGAYVFSLQLGIFICILTAGFLGSVVDSYLGAIFQQNNRSVTVPVSEDRIPVGNNAVNLVSTGIGALLTVIFKLVFI